MGTVFKLNTNGDGYVVLRQFAGGGADGANPRAGLLQGNDGVLYGTTSQGGASLLAAGTIFKLNPDGTGYELLHSFTGTNGDGASPCAALVQGLDSALYGTTYSGGTSNLGTVFKLIPAGSYTILKSFTGTGGDGANPLAGLLRATDGALYGTTSRGGSNDNGTVFRLNADGSGYTVLKVLPAAGATALNCVAGLVQGMDGALYGTTFNGGASQAGAVFRLYADGTDYRILISFETGVGANPGAGLALGANGEFYGTTVNGGSPGYGTVFSLTFRWLNLLSIEGSYIPTLRYVGFPNQSYTFQSALRANGPWINVSPPMTADATGVLTYQDYHPASARFFRTRVFP